MPTEEKAGQEPGRAGRGDSGAARRGARARSGGQCRSAPRPSAAAWFPAAAHAPRGTAPRGTLWLPSCFPVRRAFRGWLQLGLNFTHPSERTNASLGGAGWEEAVGLA